MWADIRRQCPGGEIVGQIEKKPATGAIAFKQLIGKMRNVFHQTLQRITARPDRPNDFFQRPNRLSHRLGNILHMHFNLTRVFLVRFGQAAQQGDPCQRGTQVIMQIAGNARALPFQCPLLFQMPQAALAPCFFEQTGGASHRQRQPQGCQSYKPPCLPKMRQHRQRQTRAGLVPNPIAVASYDAESILARRHIAVGNRAPGSRLAGLNPLRIQPFEAITKADPLRRIEELIPV